MGNIREIGIVDIDLWNETVKSFNDYDVFYLAEYVNAFAREDEQNGTPILILYDNGDDRAINVVFKRDIGMVKTFEDKIEKGKYYDICSPYGYGGFVGNVSNWKELMDEWQHYCVQSGFVCEFVRFNLFSQYAQNYSGIVETNSHNVVRNLEAPLDDIWMDFKAKVRKNVKKASNYGLQIIRDTRGGYLEDFLRIYYGTMERNNAQKSFYFSKEFFDTLKSMYNNMIFFHVLHDGKIISSELVIYGSQNCYSYLGGTDSNFFDLRPNDFLKYEIIKWAKEKGLKNFVLGGGYGEDDGIYQYKTCLAPNGIRNFYIGKQIFDESVYRMLCNIKKVSIDDKGLVSGFFPKYRE